jgi:U3 small nucleolar RNA-associated protein 14
VTKPPVELPKKKSTEIPLIIAPSQAEAEANPWLTTNSVVLPASEYSKPTEVRNEETSSESDDDEDNDVGDKEEGEKDQSQEQSTDKNESYGVTQAAPVDHLQMPVPNKRVEVEPRPQENEHHQMNIQEAFADDDVLAEFEKEKTDMTERDRPKATDLSLPGWGEWAGAGVPVNKRKKRKSVQKISV